MQKVLYFRRQRQLHIAIPIHETDEIWMVVKHSKVHGRDLNACMGLNRANNFYRLQIAVALLNIRHA